MCISSPWAIGFLNIFFHEKKHTVMFLVQAHNIQYSVSAVATAMASVRPPTSAAHWRRNPTQTLGFLLPWISPWFFVGFLLSPPPYAQSFLRKPSFLVLADFFP